MSIDKIKVWKIFELANHIFSIIIKKQVNDCIKIKSFE